MPRSRPRSALLGLPWAMVELHYSSRNEFLAIQAAYEERVEGFVKAKGRTRAKLKLDHGETARLFDTGRLERLIRELVHPLREVAHAYFRENDVAEPYDSKVARIYHELSILKEEHLSVSHFPEGGAKAEFARLFREVSEYYPQRLSRVHGLFDRAEKRFEKLLPQFSSDTIVLRSAFLFRDELWPTDPRDSLARILGRMFPAEGPVHGFHVIARSFLKAGFYEQAAECARMGVAHAGRRAQARSTKAQRMREAIGELDSLAARADAELAALTEQGR